MIAKNRRYGLDLAVGSLMLCGFLALLVMVFKVSGIQELAHAKSYSVTADFANIGGLKVRAPVTVSGVKVGEVTRIVLEPGRLNAKVTMQLAKNKPIPYEDTSARILTEGLLGSNYVSIVPGFEDDPEHPFLRSGDVIEKTQEAVILENLIGQLLFNVKSS
ncbi:MAG: outer membrane lipid asymmetry maintenance protein MlaD [Legionellaceae bacterium]|nr:outer membrane lipid asymmetry maintenance protein MlaD [Legionellaceae bacterium]